MSMLGYFRKRLGARQQAVQEVAETPAGKITLSFLRSLCRPDDVTFRESSLETAFFEGRRSIWLEFQAELGKDSTELVRQAEILDRQQQAIARSSEDVYGPSEEWRTQ